MENREKFFKELKEFLICVLVFGIIQIIMILSLAFYPSYMNIWFKLFLIQASLIYIVRGAKLLYWLRKYKEDLKSN